MSDQQNDLPEATLALIQTVPKDRPVALLVRHSVRGELAANDAGFDMPLTPLGRSLAHQLGSALGHRLRSLQTSPFPRCIQTADAISTGSGVQLAAMKDRLLGDPGAFVLDGRRAWENWQAIGQEGVTRHLMAGSGALPGMSNPDAAARFLAQRLLACSPNSAGQGIHVFVTHDVILAAMVARLRGHALTSDEWPRYLDAAGLWLDEQGTLTLHYCGKEWKRQEALCTFDEDDLIDFARREIAWSVGLGSGARFFLVGGAFKSLLTGGTPADLDLWAASAADRAVLCEWLIARGARQLDPGAFSDRFQIAGRVIDIPWSAEFTDIEQCVARCDIALSAVAVEHAADGAWRAYVHPLAVESIARREVRLLRPLANPKYALTSLERMRRYAEELGYQCAAEDEAEIWRVFDSRSQPEQQKMIERFRRTARNTEGVEPEVDRRRNSVIAG